MRVDLIIWIAVALLVASTILRGVRVVPQAQSVVIERLGRYHRLLGPGLHWTIPGIERVRARVDLREQVIAFPPQDMVSSDLVEVRIDYAAFFQVTDPRAVIYEVANYVAALEQLAVALLRSIIGTMEMEHALTSRERINSELRRGLDERSGRWGIRVGRAEIRSIDVPPAFRKALDRRALTSIEPRATDRRATARRDAPEVNMALGDTALRRSDPQWLGDYRLAARLGQGSQGAVYLAEGPDGERVAIKLLHGDLADSPQLRERFVREAALARMVEPFYIAQVLVTGMYGDVPYIVSEYVEGPSLQQAIIRHGPSSAAGLSRLAVATATALTAIHDAGVVHRDFKPGNVVLGPDGPRVIDFGIARSLDGDQHTLTHGIIGTPAYMAPEQARGLAVTSAADMYAWACVIVFAATGKPPFDADDKAVPHTRPELDYLGGRLRSAVEACLADDPVKRPTAPQVLTRLIQNQSLAPSSERSSVQNILETAGDAQIDHATE